MIEYKTGNILESQAEALVNTVNTVGVMGKGIALLFREAFPENYRLYRTAAENHKIRVGAMFITRTNQIGGPKYIVNFPTKQHWRNPSRMEWISQGLEDLKKQIAELSIRSIAIPPLGAGHGKLEWKDVKTLIESRLGHLDIEIYLFEPSEDVRKILAERERKSPAKLTPVRVMLLYLLYRYRALGEFATEFAAEKISYFLQRMGEKQLKLQFEKSFYGPYSGKIRHVLFALNGSYIKGFETKDLGPFEPFELVMDKIPEVEQKLAGLPQSQRDRVNKVVQLMDGFESPFSLELLASLDFLMHNQAALNTGDLLSKLSGWSERKRTLANEENIQKAVGRLREFEELGWRGS